MLIERDYFICCSFCACKKYSTKNKTIYSKGAKITVDVVRLVQDFFTSSYMQVYTNIDVREIEICGALKNVIALETGISKGMGYGDNVKAALITRGRTELERLGGRIGCSPKTFSGLTGMGDLIVTCISEHSKIINVVS